MTSHPWLTFSEYLAILEIYGYEVPEVGYQVWKGRLEEFAGVEGRERHAL